MLSLPSLSFADDITLLATTYPTFVGTFMDLCYEYTIRWRHEFHNDKSGIVTFGETKRIHYNLLNKVIGCLVTKLLTNVMSTKTLG